MASIKVKIRGRTMVFDAGTTKADIARTLFADNAANYTINEVAKAVPMAYSQAMTIAKKMDGQTAPKKAKDPLATPQAREAVAKGRSEWGQSQKAPGKRTTKPMKSPVLDAIKAGKPVDIGRISGRVGKLRTPGLPSDTDVGECANCGFDLVVHLTKEGFILKHVGMSAEEYLQTVQFCQAVPKVLIG